MAGDATRARGKVDARARPETVEGSWRERPLLGRVVRVVGAVLPLVASVFVPWAFARGLADSTLHLGVVGTMAFLVTTSLVVYATVERLCRHLLPLSMLLGLSLGFPGAAPSRLRTAFGSSSLRDAQRAALRPVADRSAADAAREVVRLAAALGRHDRLTRGHVERVGAYADLTATELGLSREDRGRLRWAALLHDIGKLAVPAEVLNKTSPLTDAEWKQIKTHPAAGDALIEPLKDWLGEWGRAVVEHHERIDGTGYPARLGAAEISLGARIVSVVDAFDVMTSHRSYQPAIRPRVARQRLVDSSGTQFDTEVVRAFLAVSSRKLAWVMGPVSLAAQVPLLAQVGQLTTAVRTAQGAAMIPASVTAVAAVSVLSIAVVNPGSADHTPDTVEKAPAVVELRHSPDSTDPANPAMDADVSSAPEDPSDDTRVDAGEFLGEESPDDSSGEAIPGHPDQASPIAGQPGKRLGQVPEPPPIAPSPGSGHGRSAVPAPPGRTVRPVPPRVGADDGPPGRSDRRGTDGQGPEEAGRSSQTEVVSELRLG